MSHIFRILYCAKTGFEVGSTGIGDVDFLLDEVRAQAGQEIIVIPWLAKISRWLCLKNQITPVHSETKIRLLKKNTPPAYIEEVKTAEY